MARKKGRFTADVSEALTKTVTEDDIKQKYGWSIGGIKVKTPDYSAYEMILVVLSIASLGYLTFVNGFNLFDPINLIQGMGVPIWAGITAAVAVFLIFTETFYEFVSIRGKIKKPTFGEVLCNKITSMLASVVAFIVYPVFLILGTIFGIAYLNYGRTIRKRQENFESYLDTKKQEIAQNQSLPVKERSEISYCTVAPQGVVSPDEDVKEEL